MDASGVECSDSGVNTISIVSLYVGMYVRLYSEVSTSMNRLNLHLIHSTKVHKGSLNVLRGPQSQTAVVTTHRLPRQNDFRRVYRAVKMFELVSRTFQLCDMEQLEAKSTNGERCSRTSIISSAGGLGEETNNQGVSMP